jgi:hypothetical protein
VPRPEYVMLRGRVNGPAANFGPTDDIVPAIVQRGVGTFSEKPAFFAEMIELFRGFAEDRD